MTKQTVALGGRELRRVGLGTNRLTDTPENRAFLQAAAAAGVKVADPHRPVLALVGDGAFTLFSSDLRTLVQERIGVCYLVLRNGGYGWLQQQAEQHDPPLSGFCFTRDEGPLVRTPGVHHAVVQRRDALVAALSEAVRVAADGTPSVVEVPVSLDDSALRPDGDFGTAH